MLIFFLNSVVLISPPNIHFREDGLSLQLLQLCAYVWQRPVVVDGPLIQFMIVYDDPFLVRVFLSYEEDRCSVGGGTRVDVPFLLLFG